MDKFSKPIKCLVLITVIFIYKNYFIFNVYGWTGSAPDGGFSVSKEMVQNASIGEVLGSTGCTITDRLGQSMTTTYLTVQVKIDNSGNIVLIGESNNGIGGWELYERIEGGGVKIVPNGHLIEPNKVYYGSQTFRYSHGTSDIIVGDIPPRVYTTGNNVKPTLQLTNPTTNQVVTELGTITISGTVKDPDTQLLTISAIVGGITKTQTIEGPATNKPFALTWTGAELPTGTYTNISVKVQDSFHSATQNYTGNIIVDKTKPKLNVNVTKKP